jgi:hypothetical protein
MRYWNTPCSVVDLKTSQLNNTACKGRVEATKRKKLSKRASKPTTWNNVNQQQQRRKLDFETNRVAGPWHVTSSATFRLSTVVKSSICSKCYMCTFFQQLLSLQQPRTSNTCYLEVCQEIVWTNLFSEEVEKVTNISNECKLPMNIVRIHHRSTKKRSPERTTIYGRRANIHPVLRRLPSCSWQTMACSSLEAGHYKQAVRR